MIESNWQAQNLIVDVGLNTGQDTEFYLAKGFRVVAIEADPDLAKQCAGRFAEHISAGQLVIVNKAVGEGNGKAKFFRNVDDNVLGTLNQSFAERNKERFGQQTMEIEVDTATLPDMISAFPAAYYIKIDIEGMDYVALQQLQASEIRPVYLSIEVSKTFDKFLTEITTLEKMGYTEFKLVQQQNVRKQIPPNPPKEGNYVSHTFPFGSAGMFGDEAPGEWRPASELISRYKTIAFMERLVGDWPIIPVRQLRGLIKRMFFDPGWHDLHARRSRSSAMIA